MALSRHPRYFLTIVLLMVTTIYVLSLSYPTLPPVIVSWGASDLADRVEKAERIYDKVLHDRQGLIQKFGPTPNDVLMFPPDKEPWPAYTVWDFFPPAFNCPHELERLGALGDGGKWLCGLSRLQEKKDCVVYSFGTNYESSFETEILTRTRNCQIWTFDNTAGSHGPIVDRMYKHRTHFQSCTLASVDAHDSQDSPKAYTLQSLMKVNGHKHIDILKMDVEGWEFDILTSVTQPFLASGDPLPFGQLLLEIHAWNKIFADFLSWWEMLETAGLRPFMTEPNLVYQNYNKQSKTDLAEYSFLNIKGYNSFISHEELVQDPTGTSNIPHTPLST